MGHLYDRLWGRVSPVDRLARLIVAVVVIAAAAIIAASLTKEDEATTATATPAAKRTPALPLCRDVKVAGDEAVACRTSKKTLYIGGEDVPILLDTTQIRVIDVRSAPRRVTIRVRLRNTSGGPQNTGKGPREVYLNVAGRQLFADPRPEVRIPADEARTVRYSFPVDAGDLRALRRAKGRAELAVAPFGAGGAGRSTTLAVARLRVALGRLTPPPAQAPGSAQPPPAITPG